MFYLHIHTYIYTYVYINTRIMCIRTLRTVSIRQYYYRSTVDLHKHIIISHTNALINVFRSYLAPTNNSMISIIAGMRRFGL